MVLLACLILSGDGNVQAGPWNRAIDNSRRGAV